MTIDSLHHVLRILAASQAMSAGLYFLAFARHRAERLVALTALAFFAYLILPVVLDANLRLAAALLAVGATAIPGLLWILTYRFFNDETSVPLWIYTLFLLYMLLSVPQLSKLAYESPVAGLTGTSMHWFNLLAQLIKLGLVISAIYIAIKGKHVDLVDPRRRLRPPLAIAASSMAVTVIVVELFAHGLVLRWLDLAGSALFTAIAFTATLALFRVKPFIFDFAPPDQKPDLTQTDIPRDNPALEKLHLLMLDQRLYSEPGLTISAVAKKVGLQEYRLRRLVNQQLGYRNFNHFLNGFRIAEAANRLRDEPDVPILTIALDVGFRSLSSFNAAFKQTYQLTPSAYREQNKSAGAFPAI